MKDNERIDQLLTLLRGIDLLGSIYEKQSKIVSDYERGAVMEKYNKIIEKKQRVIRELEQLIFNDEIC